MTEQVVNNSRQAVYYVGELQEYRSIYGYPKRRHRVYRLGPGQSPYDGTLVGFIKEERIGDENGNAVTTVFYEKNGWRRHGLIRFYASPEALLIACGMNPVYGVGDKSDVTQKISQLSQTQPRDTPPIFHLGNVQSAELPQITYDAKPQLEAPADPLGVALQALNDAVTTLKRNGKTSARRGVEAKAKRSGSKSKGRSLADARKAYSTRGKKAKKSARK